MNIVTSLDEYERPLAPARECFAASPGVEAIRSNSDDVFLELFLLHFCALGSQVTDPVRRAAERTNISAMNTFSFLQGHSEIIVEYSRQDLS